MQHRLYAIMAFLIGIAASLAAHEVKTDRINGYLVTSGYVESNGWHKEGIEVLNRYGNYRDWAIRWMDGKDPVSVNFWAYFTDFEFVAPDTMLLTYDINLGWPLGSRGNIARFTIDETDADKEIYRFTLQDKPVGVEDASLIFSGERPRGQGGATRIRFNLNLKLIWILDVLIDFNAYSADMDWRINKMIENLQEAVELM